MTDEKTLPPDVEQALAVVACALDEGQAARLRGMIEKREATIERLRETNGRQRDQLARRVEVSQKGNAILLGTQNGWPEEIGDDATGRFALLKFLRAHGGKPKPTTSPPGHRSGLHHCEIDFHGLRFAYSYDTSD